MPTRMSATSYSGAVVSIGVGRTSVIKESLAVAGVPFAVSVTGVVAHCTRMAWCHGKRRRGPAAPCD